MSTQTTDPTETKTDAHVRDYVTDPSINSPQSGDEARLAVVAQVIRVLTDPSCGDGSPLRKPFTADMGFGLTRTEQQVRWLEDARAEVLARIEGALDVIRADADEDTVRTART